MAVAGGAPALLAAQGARSPAPRVTVAALGGVAGGATLASGQLTTTVSASPSGGFAAATAARTVALQLDTRATLGGEARLALGAARRWSLVAEFGRASGGARLARTQRVTSAGSPGALAASEQTFLYDRATAWRGALGVARLVALPRAWSADVSASGVFARVRAAGEPDRCASLSGFALAVCETQRGTLVPAPTVALSAPGVGGAAAVESPLWRRLRLRARLGGDVVWTDGVRLLRDAEGPRPVFVAPGSEVRESASGRRAGVLPSATLGVAVGFGR